MSEALQPVAPSAVALKSLVDTARGLAVRAVEQPVVTQALEVAAIVKGLVVTSDTEAIALLDHIVTMQDGEKALAVGEKGVVAIPKAMEAAVKEVTGPKRIWLAAAIMEAKRSNQAWQDEKNRVAREAERVAAEERRKQEAERARIAADHAAAAARAAAENQPPPPPPPEIPPPMEDAPLEPQRKIESGQARQVETRRLTSEMVDHHEADPFWLKLDTVAAEREFRTAMARGDVQAPGNQDAPVIWRGVKFWYNVTTAVQRK